MVTVSIIDSSMVSLCREMGILLMKTSYSTIFNEGLDFTCALANIKGDMIACARILPDHGRGHAAADQDLRPGHPLRHAEGGRRHAPLSRPPLSRRATCDDLMDYAERRMRAEIAAFPDGRYAFQDVIENDGIEERPYHVAVDVFVQGDEVVADFSRSSKQAKGPINATLGVTTSASYNALLHLTDPSIPKNSGCFRPIRVIAPPGHVVNVDYPGPEVAGNTETHPRLAGIVIGAMAQCVPERAMASESCTGMNFVFGGMHPDHEEYFACYDIMSGGWGGRATADGNDCVIAINGNCRFPTEVFETRFPFRVEEFAMMPDSGGAGRFRGGLGWRRTLLNTEVEITGSQCTDRHEVKPWALFGGYEGGNGATLIRKAGSDDWLTVRELFRKTSTSKYSNIVLKPGDRIRLSVPGGGGYGEPREREPERIEEDLREGYISAESAERDYGYRGSKAIK
jgi:N-methylhydantoinase B